MVILHFLLNCHFLTYWLIVFSPLKGNVPLAEIDFWRERSAVLSCVNEQLKLPVVKKIVDVMIRADSFTAQELEKTIAELSKYYEESSNNELFLRTLERVFKVRRILKLKFLCCTTRGK